jgi:hypothetical protein
VSPAIAVALAISRGLTIGGWIAIVLVLVATTGTALASRGRFASAVTLTRLAVRFPIARVVALIGWLWISWHFFVRTSR